MTYKTILYDAILDGQHAKTHADAVTWAMQVPWDNYFYYECDMPSFSTRIETLPAVTVWHQYVDDYYFFECPEDDNY